jgi:hypothetical protein
MPCCRAGVLGDACTIPILKQQRKECSLKLQVSAGGGRFRSADSCSVPSRCAGLCLSAVAACAAPVIAHCVGLVQGMGTGSHTRLGDRRPWRRRDRRGGPVPRCTSHTCDWRPSRVLVGRSLSDTTTCITDGRCYGALSFLSWPLV